MNLADRRRYRRVNAPVFSRPAGGLLRQPRRPLKDISRGGFRVYSDERQKPGQELVLEFFFADETSATIRAQVVWIDELPPGSGAQYDVGLEYVDTDADSLKRIERVLTDVGG